MSEFTFKHMKKHSTYVFFLSLVSCNRVAKKPKHKKLFKCANYDLAIKLSQLNLPTCVEFKTVSNKFESPKLSKIYGTT